MDLSLKVILPVDDLKEYKPNEVYDAIDLDQVWGVPVPDKYHIPLCLRSTYVSMDDVKDYLKAKYPDLDLSSWSMRSPFGVGKNKELYINVGIREIIISGEDAEALNREHIDQGMYEKVDCRFDLSEYGYMFDAVVDLREPKQVDDEFIKEFTARMQKHFSDMTKKELSEDIDDACFLGRVRPCDLLILLMEAKIYADKVGGIAVLYGD